MNNYQTHRTPSTTLNLGLMATLLISGSAFAGANAGPQPERDILHGAGSRMYRDASASSTYVSSRSSSYFQTSVGEDVESVVTQFYSQLSSRQTGLEHDFEQVLFDNLWDLYSE